MCVIGYEEKKLGNFMQSNVINTSNSNRCLNVIKPLNLHFHVKATNYETKSCINTTVCMLQMSNALHTNEFRRTCNTNIFHTRLTLKYFIYTQLIIFTSYKDIRDPNTL